MRLNTLEFAAWELKYDVVLPRAEDLREDHILVQTAVAQDGWALQFAPEELRGDPDIVMSAVMRDFKGIRFGIRRRRSFDIGSKSFPPSPRMTCRDPCIFCCFFFMFLADS